MHARWISSLYHYLCDRKEIILNGYEAAGITEAVESATAILQRVENSLVFSFLLTLKFYAKI